MMEIPIHGNTIFILRRDYVKVFETFHTYQFYDNDWKYSKNDVDRYGVFDPIHEIVIYGMSVHDRRLMLVY